MKQLEVDCCIAGGGPAGIMLGLLLARAGLKVAVLEKHADFFRDFRGDTIHPSTLGLLGELGWRREFLALPHNEVTTLDAVVNGHRLHPIDFRRLPAPDNFLVLMPQWDFLNFLTGKAAAYPGFRLLMQTEVTGLIRDAGTGGVIAGVTATDPDGPLEIRARLTVACDGRSSTLRDAAGLVPKDFGAPVDVLWFRVPKPDVVMPDTLAYLDEAALLITIPRGDYLQIGFVIPKGGFDALRQSGLAAFRAAVSSAAPFLESVLGTITRWDQVKPLSVQINRLATWHLPGMLLIGDAAHAMSPAFGVGVNYAIQDAVAAANALVRPLRFGASAAAIDQDCAGIQDRRMRAVRRMQALQIAAHDSFAKPGGGAILPDPVPRATGVALAAAMPVVQRLAARIVGRGFVPEHLADDLLPGG
ncbi:FAD-dependent oxidoreductase [Rathayibacter soli]|uniref:FAD-dependent oxidoreductase n=1 Tax=Rathayibacter soli TaxID=3144168 RepID=UPI0027E3EF29|nr:FAD-dependent oxidoreductase [Glaciibacter superstes]